jgi:hypothetical protein
MEIDECMICLEPLEYDVAILNCNHKIHLKCVQQWIETKKNILNLCPICEIQGEIINIVEFKERKVEKKKKTYNCILM